MRRLLLSTCLLLTLSACASEPGEFDRMITGLSSGGSGGGSVPAQPAPPQSAPAQPNLPATGASKMLPDPESRESNTSEYVYAFTDEEAESICQNIANQRGWRLDRKVAESFVNSLGKRKYTCYWTIFEAPGYDDSRHR